MLEKIKLYQQKQAFNKLLRQLNPANVSSEENQKLLRLLPFDLREEVAFITKTMTYYYDEEVTHLRNDEERGALLAAPSGYDLSELNGINIGSGNRTINQFLLPCDAHDGNWKISTHEVYDSRPALKCWAHDLPFKPNSIDYIIALHILEHEPNPIEVVLHWLDIVKPGGGIGVVLPDWRYTWDARNDHNVWSHRWNPTPNLVHKLFMDYWSDFSSLEFFCTYNWKLSFNFVLRKHGTFSPFNINEIETLPTGNQLSNLGTIQHSDD